MELADLCRAASAQRRPTDEAPVIRRAGSGLELACLRWGLEPRPGGDPVINLRAEGLAAPENRCLVPASDFTLFTGARSPKRRWRVRLEGSDWFCFAAVWRPASKHWPQSYAVLTIPAAPDLAPLTERQLAVLPPELAPGWLDEGGPDELLRPLPAGSYVVEPG